LTYDTWLQSDKAFERFHGLDEFHEDEVQRRREREERRIDEEYERYKERKLREKIEGEKNDIRETE